MALYGAIPRFFVFAVLLAGLLLPGMALAASSQPQSSPSHPSRGGADMDRTILAERKMRELFDNAQASRAASHEESDPDFAQMRDRLLYGEIAWNGTLDDKMRELITLVVLTAVQTPDGIKPHVEAALRAGATPVEIKEALYQCAPYIGFPKTGTTLLLVNEVFREKGIPLPVASQKTVTEANRYEEGLKVQKSIFGEAIDVMHRNTPENQKPIMQNYLSSFTRTGLDLKSREILTFCIISSLGGCESQVRSHVQGNVNVGNSKENLVDALAQMLPYIGFPRTLNALGCVNAVIPENRKTACRTGDNHA